MIVYKTWIRLFAMALLLSPIAKASESTTISAPTYQMIQAAIAERIRDEFSRQMLDQDMKAALLNSAAPEDKIELQRLLASFKTSKSHSFEAVGTRLRMSDKKGQVVFEVAPPELGKNDFLINGRSWTMPESGSILRDLNRHLNPTKEAPKRTGAGVLQPLLRVVSGLTSTLEASSQNPETLPLYYYVRANGNSTPQSLYQMIRSGSLDQPLLHGAHFQSTGELDWAKAIFKGLTLARYDVQCTPEGAKGYAIVGGSKVEFLARPDQGVQLKSDGHSQIMLFEPHHLDSGGPYRSRIEHYGNKVRHSSAGKLEEDFRRNGSESDLVNLDQTSRSLCESAYRINYAGGLRELLKGPCHRLMYIHEGRGSLASHYKGWIVQNFDSLKKAAAQFDKLAVVSENSLELKACTDASCNNLLSGKEFESYRLPRNKTEGTVESALAFEPKSSPAANSKRAKIEYNCPTKNSACQSVAIIGEDSLSDEDWKRAKELVARANESLRWKQYDPSVVQPLAKLRLLGPCCADTECRALAYEKGVNLMPTKGKGTAK
jgi:hypothetical protein